MLQRENESRSQLHVHVHFHTSLYSTAHNSPSLSLFPSLLLLSRSKYPSSATLFHHHTLPYFLIPPPPPSGPPVHVPVSLSTQPVTYFLTTRRYTSHKSAIASSDHVVSIPFAFAFFSSSASAFFFALKATSSSSSSFMSFFPFCDKLQRPKICVNE